MIQEGQQHAKAFSLEIIFPDHLPLKKRIPNDVRTSLDVRLVH